MPYLDENHCQPAPKSPTKYKSRSPKKSLAKSPSKSASKSASKTAMLSPSKSPCKSPSKSASKAAMLSPSKSPCKTTFSPSKSLSSPNKQRSPTKLRKRNSLSSLFSTNSSSVASESTGSESSSRHSGMRLLFQRTSSICKSLLVPDIVSCEPEEVDHDLTEFSWDQDFLPHDDDSDHDDELNIPEELREVQDRANHMRQDVDDRIVKYEKTYRDALTLAKARYLNGSRNSAVVAMRKHYNYSLRANHLYKAQARLASLKESLDNYLELAKFESRNGLLPAKSVSEKAREYEYKLNKWAKALRKVPETSRTDEELLEILADICPPEKVSYPPPPKPKTTTKS